MTLHSYLSELYAGVSKQESVLFWDKANNIREFHRVDWLLRPGNLDKVLSHFGNHDLYLSFNTFRNKKKVRANRNQLFNVYSFCIDVDYKRGKDKATPVTEAIAAIKELFGSDFGSVIPTPSYIEYSNQFRLIYLLRGHASGEKQFKALELVAKRMVEAINRYPDFDFCAETQGLHSFLRIPGSINTKTWDRPTFKGYVWNEEISDWVAAFDKCGDVVCVEKVETHYPVELETRLTLSEYMEEVLGAWEQPSWYKKWKEEPQKKTVISDLITLNQSRMNDIVTIQKAKIAENGAMGYRNKLCFAYFIHAKNYYFDEDKAIQAVNDFNAHFPAPLKRTELKSCISSARHKHYTMKNITLLHFVDVSEAQADEWKLSIAKGVSRNNKDYCKAYRNKKKEAMHRAGKTKEQQIQKAKNTIVKLRKRKKTNKQICSSLKITSKTLERYISQLLKEHRILSKKFEKKANEIIKQQKETESFAETFCRSIAIVAEKITDVTSFEMALFNKACKAQEARRLYNERMEGNYGAV